MSDSILDHDELQAILRADEAWYGSSGAGTAVTVDTVTPGASGASIRRVTMGHHSFILKQSTRWERRALDWLAPTGAVPRMMSLKDVDDAEPFLVLEDLGGEHRPTSFDPLPDGWREQEAAALATIHLRGTPPGDDVPLVDEAYLEWTIEEQFFRPAWSRSMHLEAFRDRFGRDIPGIEQAAATIIDEVMTLVDEPALRTLVHLDINPSNVMVKDGAPRIIDWGSSRVGPLVLDLPHHFETRELAEIYRRALGMQGRGLESAAFDRWYAIAARYTGLRYVWWTLDWFAAEPDDAARWVSHYLELVLRNADPA
jgi:aminoglycoside phosphotransferase (APT) family kinase protein